MVFVLHKDLVSTAFSTDEIGALLPGPLLFLPELESTAGDLGVETEIVRAIGVGIEEASEVFAGGFNLPLHSPVLLSGLEGPRKEAGLYGAVEEASDGIEG